MLGYASERESFAVEVAFNYGIEKYDVSHDSMRHFIVDGIAEEVVTRDGYKFTGTGIDDNDGKHLGGVSLNVQSLESAVKFYTEAVGLHVLSRDQQSAKLCAP